MKTPPCFRMGLLLLGALLSVSASMAATVSRLQVRIVTGAQELVAGSELELRIYESGKNARRYSLVHGEAWLPDSTHLIPVRVNDAFDSRNVVRFALYYRSGNALAPALDIASADVLLPNASGSPERLLNATLSGVIARQGELATTEREAAQLACRNDGDCDDGKSCNGRERCAPHTAGADARGCVKGAPRVCPVNQVCGEGTGCRGIDSRKAPAAAGSEDAAPDAGASH